VKDKFPEWFGHKVDTSARQQQEAGQ